MAEKIAFHFWLSEKHGLIRQRFSAEGIAHPEVWRDDRWVTGSPYVMDAITGMGEDPYSCGESAEEVTDAEADAHARTQGIRLYELP